MCSFKIPAQEGYNKFRKRSDNYKVELLIRLVKVK